MINKVKDEIIKLRESGKSYREIAKLLKCSKGTVCYHCGVGQKEKTYNRNVLSKAKTLNKIKCKIREFSSNKEKSNAPLFTTEEFLEKVGENPVCYLSGKDIDINDSKSWSIDHKIPRSRGGNNTLDNAGICNPMINLSKTSMTVDEFLEVCKIVLENNGHTVIKNPD